MSYELHLRVEPAFDLARSGAVEVGSGLAITRHGGLTLIEVPDDRDVGEMIQSLLIPVEGRWPCRIPGVDRILYAVRISPETLDEVLRLADGKPDYESFEVPEIEERMWRGERAHPDWRESNLPHVDPEVLTWVQCLRCGGKLTGSRAVVWSIPSGHMQGMWSEVGLHLPVCQVEGGVKP